jgi:hypothetical protein
MLKKDITLYKNGDRAAEMRLISFVFECEKKLDRAGLVQLEGAGGKVAAAARIAAEKVEVHLRSKGNQDQLKKRIKQCLDMAEAAGIFRDPSGTFAVWRPLLKEAADLRWGMHPNQEVYNIDLRVRRMIELARKLGISL